MRCSFQTDGVLKTPSVFIRAFRMINKLQNTFKSKIITEIKR